MKNATKKGVWIIAIMAIGSILFLGLGYQSGKGGEGSSNSESKTAADSQSGSIFDNWGVEQEAGQVSRGGQQSASKPTQNSTTSSNSYSLNTQSGGVLGGSYLLKNMSSTKGDGYESANVFVKSVNNSLNFPKYAAELSGDTIVVTLSDTRNFDIDAGSTSYDGYNPQNINGRVIKSLKWEQAGENIVRVRIRLKYAASFKTAVLNNPPTLEVRIKI